MRSFVSELLISFCAITASFCRKLKKHSLWMIFGITDAKLPMISIQLLIICAIIQSVEYIYVHIYIFARLIMIWQNSGILIKGFLSFNTHAAASFPSFLSCPLVAVKVKKISRNTW